MARKKQHTTEVAGTRTRKRIHRCPICQERFKQTLERNNARRKQGKPLMAGAPEISCPDCRIEYIHIGERQRSQSNKTVKRRRKGETVVLHGKDTEQATTVKEKRGKRKSRQNAKKRGVKRGTKLAYWSFNLRQDYHGVFDMSKELDQNGKPFGRMRRSDAIQWVKRYITNGVWNPNRHTVWMNPGSEVKV